MSPIDTTAQVTLAHQQIKALTFFARLKTAILLGLAITCAGCAVLGYWPWATLAAAIAAAISTLYSPMVDVVQIEWIQSDLKVIQKLNIVQDVMAKKVSIEEATKKITSI